MASPNIQDIPPSSVSSTGPPKDLEKGQKRPTGYEGLAQFMGVYPELAIFRRFGALNLQNVLFLQAEITALEEIYSEVAANQNHYPEFSEEWYEKVKRGDLSPDGPNRRGRDFDDPSGRYKLVLRLHKLLNEYSMLTFCFSFLGWQSFSLWTPNLLTKKTTHSCSKHLFLHYNRQLETTFISYENG